MLHVALWEPEIPPNTGNVARLCAATGTRLHLIGRLGFRTDDKSVKRAGLDYWPHVDWVKHATFDDFLAAVSSGRIAGSSEFPSPAESFGLDDLPHKGGGVSSTSPLVGEGGGTIGSTGRGVFRSSGVLPRIWAVDNPAPTSYTHAAFADGDVLLFGSESKGLPPGVREQFADRTISIPMKTPAVRSLNLATAVGVVLYEALRQIEQW